MRKMSVQRRRLVVQAGGLASLHALMPSLLPRGGWREWVWLSVMAALMVRVIVMMIRLRRAEGCA